MKSLSYVCSLKHSHSKFDRINNSIACDQKDCGLIDETLLGLYCTRSVSSVSLYQFSHLFVAVIGAQTY